MFHDSWRLGEPQQKSTWLYELELAFPVSRYEASGCGLTLLMVAVEKSTSQLAVARWSRAKRQRQPNYTEDIWGTRRPTILACPAQAALTR